MTDGSRAGGDSSLSLIGSTIAGKYEILSLVGEGGMGAVYKASHLLMRGIVAIKMLHPNMAEPSKLKRFQQEAQTTFRLSHPNIITVHDFGVTDNGRPYLVMDYLQGVSLADVIKEQGRVPVDRVLDIAIQACSGLAHAHSMGIVHRDLKPSNIMLVQSDSDWDMVKIVDFGIAKIIPTEGEELHRLTQTGEVFGSPYYMSPEQCMGQQPDLRSDVYSFGCLLYEALVGEPPFKGTHVFETFHKHMSEMPAALSIPGCDRSVLEQLDAVVFKAMEKSPDRRFQSMAQLKAELEVVQSGLSGGSGFRKAITGGFTQMFRQARRQIAAHPKIAIAILVLLLTAPAASGFPAAYGMLTRRGPTEQEMQWYSTPPVVLAKRSYYEYAERTMMHVVQMIRRSDDPCKMKLMRYLGEQAEFYSKYGEWQRASQCYLELQGLYKEQRLENSRMYADICERLAECCFQRGLLQEPIGLYEAEIAIRKLTGDTTHIALSISRVADINFIQGRLLDAAKNYEEAIRLWREQGKIVRQYDPELSEVALSISRLADIDRLQGHSSKAEAEYRGALEFWNFEKAGPEQVNEGLCLDRLALVCEQESKMQEADSLFAQALASLEKTLSPDHPFIATVLQNHADLLWKENLWWESLRMKMKAASILSKARGQ